VPQGKYVFQNKTNKFPNGLPMGGPLSAIVADAFMENLELLLLDITTPLTT